MFIENFFQALLFISTGAIQRIFYRQDRHCHFLNWLVIIDVLGYVVYSHPGFIGRTNDSACLRLISEIKNSPLIRTTKKMNI